MVETVNQSEIQKKNKSCATLSDKGAKIMHELGVTFHIMDHLEKVAAENKVTHVRKVTLELGEVSTVIESYLQNCWTWAAKAASVRWIWISGGNITCTHVLWRLQADISNGKNMEKTCPHCGSEHTYLLQGNEFNIKGNRSRINKRGRVKYVFQIYGETAGWRLLGWYAGICRTCRNEWNRKKIQSGRYCLFPDPSSRLSVYFYRYLCWRGNGEPTGHWIMIHTYTWTAGSIMQNCMRQQQAVSDLWYWSTTGEKLGKSHGFKSFSVYRVAINILIAVASDFESTVRAGSLAGGWWLSSEGVWLYGGWWNVLNGLAGILNIFCMTGWWGIYSSKDKKICFGRTWSGYMSLHMISGISIYISEPADTFLVLRTGTSACTYLCGVDSGIKAVGFRTVQTHWLSGACSHRYSRCSRMRAVSQQSLPYTDRAASSGNGKQYADYRRTDRTGNHFRTVICGECIRLRIHPETRKSTEKNPWKNEIFTDTKDYKEAMERA